MPNEECLEEKLIFKMSQKIKKYENFIQFSVYRLIIELCYEPARSLCHWAQRFDLLWTAQYVYYIQVCPSDVLLDEEAGWKLYSPKRSTWFFLIPHNGTKPIQF